MSKIIIPKNIYQTYPGHRNSPIPFDIAKNIEYIKKINPDWKYFLFRDDDIITFIKKYYNIQTLKIYLKINPDYGPARADFFRYLLIYRLGGVYLDIKSATSRNLNDIVGNNEYILQHWWLGGPFTHLFNNQYGEFQQWNIMSIPNHPFLKAVLKKTMDNIVNYKYSSQMVGKQGVLFLTGPAMYTSVILPLLDKYKHKIYYNNNSGGLIYNNLSNPHSEYFKKHYINLRSRIIL